MVGPNGAGKSTLLNLASRMLTPTAGSPSRCAAAVPLRVWNRWPRSASSLRTTRPTPR
ncbi:ATP-binding cassette domain-containing protein [Streptomyces sp. LUP30]|uniref:ATP-binding cassette domain-containing protein n=1 Tax=Streptomyces sp. LUP30 TaxID=1890285 RepID=UPI0035215E94